MKKIILIFLVLLISLSVGCTKNNNLDEKVDKPINTSIPEVVEKVETPLTIKHKLNNDIILWLTIEGCEIDNPIFQGDDNDQYLRLDEDGNSDIWGCYFLDYINSVENGNFTDKVNIIYGHAKGDNPDNKKFSKLKRFKDEKFALSNQIFTLETLEGKNEWLIFAATDMPISIDYIDPMPDEEKYESTLNYLVSNSYVDFGVDVTVDDQILLLSTCTSDKQVRFVIAAVQK